MRGRNFYQRIDGQSIRRLSQRPQPRDRDDTVRMSPRTPRIQTEIAQQFGIRVTIAIEQCNFELARRIIDEAQEAEHSLGNVAVRSKKPTRAALALPLTRLRLHTRTVNALEGMGICNVEQLLYTTKDELLTRANIGEKTIKEILNAVEEIGFYSKPKDKDDDSDSQEAGSPIASRTV